jgi:hypothetical protein
VRLATRPCGRALAGLVLAGLGVPTPGRTAPTVQPGGWTHVSKMESAVIPGVPNWLLGGAKKPKTRKTCLSPAEAQDDPQALFRSKKGACQTRRFLMAGGRIDSLAICADKRLDAPLTVTSTGSYTATSYRLRSISVGMRHGKPLRIETSASGRLTHGC